MLVLDYRMDGIFPDCESRDSGRQPGERRVLILTMQRCRVREDRTVSGSAIGVNRARR
jgi:hypothetical protein